MKLQIEKNYTGADMRLYYIISVPEEVSQEDGEFFVADLFENVSNWQLEKLKEGNGKRFKLIKRG